MTSPLGARASRLFSPSTALRLICAAGLVVDARIHLKLAPAYDAIKSSAVSQGELFRIEAGLALAAALLMVVVRNRLTALIAVSVASGGLVALLVYRYFDIGAFGPLPPMYEPVWYSDKVTTCIAQAISTMVGLGVLLAPIRLTRRTESPA